jgi:hypothetical protein
MLGRNQGTATERDTVLERGHFLQQGQRVTHKRSIRGSQRPFFRTLNRANIS